MFSNSVTVPAGTFREAASEAEDSLSSPPLTSSVLASSDKKSKYLIGKSILLYLVNFFQIKLTSMRAQVAESFSYCYKYS